MVHTLLITIACVALFIILAVLVAFAIELIKAFGKLHEMDGEENEHDGNNRANNKRK